MRTLMRNLLQLRKRKPYSAASFAAASVAHLLLAGWCAAQTGATVTLSFEGLKDLELISDYYNGGLGGSGSGPGPNYGVVFGSGAQAIISELDGGAGNFSHAPSGSTVTFFETGGGLTMNVPAGFTTGFSFYYAAAFDPGTVRVYDGLNATGTLLATLSLAVTGSQCSGSAQAYSCWSSQGVTFSGVARSVNFGGSDNSIGFDNITLGSQTPGSGLLLNTLTPSSATAGGAQFTLTADGAEFARGAQVRWNGNALPTTFVSGTRLTAQVAASLIQTAGTAQVTVANPAGSPSNARTFTINAALSLNTLTPSSATAGGAQFTLTADGAGFASGAQVRWNGNALPTTFVSGTRLTAQVAAGLIQTAGTAQVTVANPAGSVSNALPFTINPALSLSTLTPSSATAGGAQFTLTADGAGFVSGAQVRWNGNALPTTFVSGTRLTAQVAASLIQAEGMAQVTVANPAGNPSNALPFTIDAALSLSTLTPSSATAGGAQFTLTADGTGFVSGAQVRWNGNALPTTFASGTRLTAQVAAGLIQAEGTAQVTVANPAGNPSNALTFTINPAPAPTLTALTPSSVTAGGGQFTLTVDGTGFLSGAQVRWDGNALTTAFAGATRLTGVVPASLIASAGAATVTVANPASAASNGLTFTINQPVPAVPAVTLNLPSAASPSQPAAVTLQLAGAAATVPVDVTLTLSFTPGVTGLPAGYQDPAMVFVASGGSTLDFTLPAGTTSFTLPQNGAFQPGTVAGTARVTVTRMVASGFNVLPSPAPSATVPVAPAVPVISPNSVRIVNVTATGLEVELSGYSTVRDLSNAAFTFTAAAGTVIDGSATVTVDLTNSAAQWYGGAESRGYGSAFYLRVPFAVSGGSASLLQSVSVSLRNSAGQMQTPVSGGR